VSAENRRFHLLMEIGIGGAVARSPCHTTGRAGPHPAVQRVTLRHQAVVEYQESQSTQWATQDGVREYSLVATGRADYPPSVRQDPDRPRADVASHIALCRVSTVSRSWIACDVVSIPLGFSAPRAFDRSRSNSSSPLSRPQVPSSSVPD
jgi:hypothetical protein